MNSGTVQKQLRNLANPAIAEHCLQFFKTGKGEYGEGDKFLGVRVPAIRAIAREHKDLPIQEILHVLRSSYHEERLLALIMLVNRFEKAEHDDRQRIYNAYLDNTEYVNGWDLVDGSAHQIVGAYLFDRGRRKLFSLAKSRSLWERRISIISTYYFIKRNQYEDTLKISRYLLHDNQDLIHKAVGWMLREVGNRDREAEEIFLLEHYSSMPRTMLRYAIEKFDEEDRKLYLTGGK